MYLQAIDEDGVPWGAALNKPVAIQTSDNKVSIKQLRFSRERRGILGVLSTAGELQVYQTRREFVEPGSDDDKKDSPLLLQIRKSYTLSSPYFDDNKPTKYEDRIISFDWMNIASLSLPARVLALRANGKFEVVEMPAASAGDLNKFVPWKAPHESMLTCPRFLYKY